MSFSLYLMASHPEIQEKCQEELRDIFGEDTERAATSGDLANMKYLEMCLKESLRLYQSVPIITRTIGEDVVIEDKLIPAGTNCIMGPCLLRCSTSASSPLSLIAMTGEPRRGGRAGPRGWREARCHGEVPT